LEGQAEDLFELIRTMHDAVPDWPSRFEVLGDLLKLPPTRESRGRERTRQRHEDVGRARIEGRKHSVARDRAAVAHHYNVSNEFYALWLDSQMVYSCAYFKNADDTLEQAQTQKLDLICRKLRLQPGQKLLDIGCGWGGLILHAAKYYGVDATGVTLSQPQCGFARQRIEREGLSDRCRVLVRDYREIEETGFDALASVGMCEHVGAKMMQAYFSEAWKRLKPGGVFLNHGISNRKLVRWQSVPSFVDAYVFPDGQLVPLHVLLAGAEKAGFEVRDVESLREHYAQTLRHWVRRLEAHKTEARTMVNEPTYRVWRLYMAASSFGFQIGVLNLYQTLLIKPDAGHSRLPLTREDWYEPRPENRDA
jgi:cyclopropane-fatty-acyl-phospholipid synthase